MGRKLGAEGLLANRRTAAEALTAVTGAAPLKVVPKEPEAGETRRPRKRSEPDRTEGVLYRVRRSHREALIEEAMKRAQERGSGKLNASEVLCEILDDWMARRR